MIELASIYRGLYLHRKNKNYIKTETLKIEGTNKIKYTIYTSNNGIDGEVTKSGIFSDSQLPEPDSNILKATINLNSYLRKNGYKECNTIVQTKNGIKFK